MKIDLHTHILPERWPDLKERYGYGGFARLEHTGPGCARMVVERQLVREVDERSWDPARRLADCDRDGVRVQVLSTAPALFSYWARGEDAFDLSRLLNDHIAEVVAAAPCRFVGLGTVPMQDPRLAARELTRCVRELGFSGVQIGTTVGGRSLDQPGVIEFLEAAQELSAAVFVHPGEVTDREAAQHRGLPWPVGMPEETAAALCAVIFGGVLERLPGLKIGFAHGGGAYAATFGRICKNALQGSFFVDSLVHDAVPLRRLIELVGSNRVALGSDYPLPRGEGVPGRLIESMPDLTVETRERLLAGTALEFLGLDRARFEPVS